MPRTITNLGAPCLFYLVAEARSCFLVCPYLWQVCGLIVESVLHVFVCLLGHLLCDVGVMSDRLFLSPPRSSATEIRRKKEKKKSKQQEDVFAFFFFFNCSQT